MFQKSYSTYLSILMNDDLLIKVYISKPGLPFRASLPFAGDNRRVFKK